MDDNTQYNIVENDHNTIVFFKQKDTGGNVEHCISVNIDNSDLYTSLDFMKDMIPINKSFPGRGNFINKMKQVILKWSSFVKKRQKNPKKRLLKNYRLR